MLNTPLLTLVAIIGLTSLTRTSFAETKQPHIVLVAGTLHYSPELTLPVFAKELDRFGFRTTVVMGVGDPEKKTENVLPGIEALNDADAAIFFMRFLNLPDEEWQPIEHYVAAGKPVIGLRTANHSFKYPKGHERFDWNDGFGRRVIGTPYIVHQSSVTQISVVEKHLKHPIMAHVDTAVWESLGTLYLTRLQPGCIPLMSGTGTGKMRLLERSFGTTLVNESEADIVAWAWENEWGGKVFGSTLGHPGDFAEESFTRLLVNSVFWAVGKTPPGADTKINTWDIKRADKQTQSMPHSFHEQVGQRPPDVPQWFFLLSRFTQWWLPCVLRVGANQTMNTRALALMLISLGFLLGAGTVRAGSPLLPGIRIAIVGNTFADQLRSHGYLETLLLQHWREEPVSIRNLGWAGDMLSARDRPTNFPPEESTLRDHQTDVIIACFGMGESFDGKAGIENFKSDLKAFIVSHRGKQYNGESDVRLILVSPIAYEDLGELTPKVEERNRDLQRYTEAMQKVAAAEKVPFVNLYEPTRALMSDPDAIPLTTNGIHLNEYGYWVVSRILYEGFFENESAPKGQPWHLTIDAAASKGTGQGLSLSGLSSSHRELSFRITEETSPSLPPPTQRELPASLNSRRDMMTVKNLEPGKYVLMIDGERVASASHDEWAEGVAVDSSPAHRDGEAFRHAVYDKNLQFIYSWKALNQVHIVGERRNSPSGRALPAEIVAFKELADQKDAALGGGIELKTREWRLIPDTN